MIVQTKRSSKWQKRRSNYNHNWLKNSYTTGEIRRWVAFLSGNAEGGDFTKSRFTSYIEAEWVQNGSEILGLLEEYQDAMSPSSLFDEGALSHVDDTTEKWLRPMCVAIWKAKHGADDAVENVHTAYHSANTTLQELSTLVSVHESAALTSGSVFLVKLNTFLRQCQELAEAVHRLESSVKVT